MTPDVLPRYRLRHHHYVSSQGQSRVIECVFYFYETVLCLQYDGLEYCYQALLYILELGILCEYLCRQKQF